MIDLNSLKWSKINSFKWKVENRKDDQSFIIDSQGSPLIRLDIAHWKNADKAYKFGQVQFQTIVNNQQTTCKVHDIYLGTNLLIYPKEIKTRSTIWINQFLNYTGNYSLRAYIPKIDQNVEDFYKQDPVIISNESLLTIIQNQELLSEEIITTLSEEINVTVTQELQAAGS